jgi:phosphatidylinositol alpha-mannosyltransferase
MRVALVCPYGLDVPGGVQNHVRDLAYYLQSRGHEVAVYAPVDNPDETLPLLPDFVTRSGRTVAVPYNGSVARVAFGPRVASRVRKWVRDGDFDVLHVHEPTSPSLGMLACLGAPIPVVATFHTANPHSRTLSVASALVDIVTDRIDARIAVSEQARLTILDHLDTDAAVIPNGIYVTPFADAARDADAVRADELARRVAHRPRLVFLGRLTEPRKGLGVLLAALPSVLEEFGDLGVDVIGRGETASIAADLDEGVRRAVEFHGEVDDATKASMLAAADIYVAPHTGQESFGIVLVEAMAAGAAVVASSLPAFVDVLAHGSLGVLVPPDDPVALARGLRELLADDVRRGALRAAAMRAAGAYDWSVIGRRIEAVYELATGTAGLPGSGRRRPGLVRAVTS